MATNWAAVGVALRVLGTAATRELIADLPGAVRVYGTTLAPAEIRWLFHGMTAPEIRLCRDGGLEDVEITGTLLGRAVKVVLVAREHAGLIGDLRAELDAARARVLASAR